MRSFLGGISAYSRDIKLFLTYSLVANIGIGVFQLLFNLYLIQLGRDEAFIGKYQAVSTLTMAGISLGLGYIVNRFGVWRVVAYGFTFFLFASVLSVVVTGNFWLLVIAGLSGAGTAFLFTPTMPFIVELTTRQERHGVAALAFSFNSLAITLGSLIGGFGARIVGAVGNLAVPSPEAYRYTLLLGLAVAAFGLVPLFFMTPERKRAVPEDEPDSPAALAHGTSAAPKSVRKHMIVFIAVGGLMSLGAGAVFPFFNVYLETLGASSGSIGLIYASAGLTAAALGLLSPWVARRFGSLTGTVIVRLAPIPWYLLLIAAPVLPIAVVAHILRTTSINMAWPIDSTYISEILPARARATVFALRSGAWNLGWSLSSLVAGYAIVSRGYNITFVAYMFFMFVAMALFYVYFSRNAPEDRSHSSPVEPIEPEPDVEPGTLA